MNTTIAKTTAALAELRKATVAVEREIDANRQEIEKALQRRESLQDPPVSRAEFAEILCSVVDRTAAFFPHRFCPEKLFEQALKWPMWDDATAGHIAEQNNIVPEIFSGLADGKWSVRSLPLICFFFGDRIKDLIHNLVENMNYPDSEAGMPVAERRTAIAEISTKIKNLQQREVEIITAAQEAGLKIDDPVLSVY